MLKKCGVGSYNWNPDIAQKLSFSCSLIFDSSMSFLNTYVGTYLFIFSICKVPNSFTFVGRPIRDSCHSQFVQITNSTLKKNRVNPNTSEAYVAGQWSHHWRVRKTLEKWVFPESLVKDDTYLFYLCILYSHRKLSCCCFSIAAISAARAATSPAPARLIWRR